MRAAVPVWAVRVQAFVCLLKCGAVLPADARRCLIAVTRSGGLDACRRLALVTQVGTESALSCCVEVARLWAQSKCSPVAAIHGSGEEVALRGVPGGHDHPCARKLVARARHVGRGEASRGVWVRPARPKDQTLADGDPAPSSPPPAPATTNPIVPSKSAVRSPELRASRPMSKPVHACFGGRTGSSQVCSACAALAPRAFLIRQWRMPGAYGIWE